MGWKTVCIFVPVVEVSLHVYVVQGQDAEYNIVVVCGKDVSEHNFVVCIMQCIDCARYLESYIFNLQLKEVEVEAKVGVKVDKYECEPLCLYQ